MGDNAPFFDYGLSFFFSLVSHALLGFGTHTDTQAHAVVFIWVTSGQYRS